MTPTTIAICTGLAMLVGIAYAIGYARGYRGKRKEVAAAYDRGRQGAFADMQRMDRRRSSYATAVGVVDLPTWAAEHHRSIEA